MTFTLLEIELHRHSQSWIAVLSFNYHSLFQIDWDYNREVKYLEVMFVRIV